MAPRMKTLGCAGDLEPSKILDAVTRSGQNLFLLEWTEQEVRQYVPCSEANIRWPELVITFYEAHMAWDDDVPAPESPEGLGMSLVEFAEGLEPEEITGAADFVQGGRVFLMKWKNSEDTDFVRADQANVICPQLVIKYYEQFAEFPPIQE